MKKILILAFLALVGGMPSHAQQLQTVRESALTGTWKMEMNIASAIRRETTDADPLGKAIARGITGFVESFTEDLDIRFTFKHGGDLDIITRYAQEKPDHDSGKWRINKSGRLEIDGSVDDKVSFDGTDEWVLVNGALCPLRDDGTVNSDIRLIRIRAGK